MNASVDIVGDGKVVVGNRTVISPSAKFIFQRPSIITIEDYCVIGDGVKFVVNGGSVYIGDWTTLHDNCLVLSSEGVRIGQHCWFGQNSVLDGSGGLTIGNGVRVGMYSQIWSHVAAGEQIEGCTLYGHRPVVIEDNVWLVGSCICASGITVGERSTALIGSNITRSFPSNVVLAGSPATVKEALSFYRPITIDEKWSMIGGWLKDSELLLGIERVGPKEPGFMAFRWADRSRLDEIVFVRSNDDELEASRRHPEATICNIETKMYRKRLTDIEQTVLKLLANNKARFLSFR